MKSLIIIPTYNECENISSLLDTIVQQLPETDLLIIDDASPDGTGRIVAERARTDARITLLSREGKAGLGTAYIAGFRWALAHDYAVVIGMDADFSHDPHDLPRFIEQSHFYDLVIGSRYIAGGSTADWSLSRRLLSRLGNLVARTALGLPVQDCTTGYKCYRRELLASIDLDAINLVGYGFLIESTYQCYLRGAQIKEIPIVFRDRRKGKSKMSYAIAVESLGYVIRRRLQRIHWQLIGRRHAEG